MILNLFSHMGVQAFNTLKADGNISVFNYGRFLLLAGVAICRPWRA
jgi:hypothetical protein